MKDDRIASGGRSDNILIKAVATGDQKPMGELFRCHNVNIFRFVIHLVGDTNVAEDIVEEVFFEIWRHAGQFEGRSQVSTWMLAIARFKVLAERRRRRHIQLQESAAESSIPDEGDNPEKAVLKNK